MALNWKQIQDVLDAALELPPENRTQYLDQACADAEVRRQVESLILSHEEAGSFLQEPAMASQGNTSAGGDDGSQADFFVGRRIGPYQLIKPVGQGGMGAVFRAARADDQYQKQVAIKLVRSGLGSRFAVARFKSERQILAKLEHPNIARLLDGGATDDGWPYFVMELVDGQPIDQYCDSHKLTIRDRLLLFRIVCSAVQYAHQNLIVHRDLKPANILVTSEGDPKLLDFGIAKILDAKSFPQGAELTVNFLRMLTPQYASPEQLRGESISTASDVYSLGVVLYGLLSGCPPYALEGLTTEAIARMVCEKEPARPSVAASRAEELANSGDNDRTASAPDAISSKRSTNSQRLVRDLSDDLDNIVLKALRKEPQHRYSSAEQFSEDIRCHLEGLPVGAHQDTLLYRTRKFIRRNKVSVAAVALVVFSLCAGLATTLWEAHVARVERAKAERRFHDVRELANSLVFDVHDSIQNLPGSTPARKLIVERALHYLDQLSTDAGEDVSLQRELAAAYRKLGQVQGSDAGSNLGDTRGSQESFAKAVKLSEAVVARNPRNLNDLKNLAYSYALTRSSENQRKAMEIRQGLVQTDPSSLNFRQDLSLSYWWAGSELTSRNDFAGASEKYRESLKLCQQLVDASPPNTGYRRNLSYTHKRLGAVLIAQKQFAEGLEQYRAAMALDERLIAENPDDAQLRYDITFTYSDIGYTLGNTGDRAAALASYREALAIRQALSAADPKDVKVRGGVARSYNYIGIQLHELGRDEEAVSAFRSAATIREALASVDPADNKWPLALAYSYSGLGSSYASLAAKSHEPAPKRLALWRQARHFLQLALPFLQREEEHHALVGDDVGEPERIEQEIAKCDAAIRKVQGTAGPLPANASH